MPRPQSVAEQPCLEGMPSLPALSTLRRLRQYGAKVHSQAGDGAWLSRGTVSARVR